MAVYDYRYTNMDGVDVSLSEYEGKVLLLVNTASKCGFTPQYAGLEQLWETYRDQGLVVVGFPCNQFLHQDPGSNAEIQEFCSLRYGVSFPLSQKIDVKGDNALPLFVELSGGKKVKWNFTKFLIDKEGNLVERFESKVKPEKIAASIEKLL
jgi:glutathione peroxidase